jgi:lysozyme
MIIGPDGIALIKEFEGCRLKSYRDQRGVWTCGWGQTGPSVTGNTHWTQAQADAKLVEALEIRSAQMSKILGDAETTQSNFDAMMSLAYNIGMGAFQGSEVCRDHKAGKYEAAAQAFLNWDNINHHEDKGLHRRRLAERALYERG